MIGAVGMLQFVVRLRMIDHISFFAFAVVSFRSQISALCSLVMFFTSWSLALYSSEWIPSLSPSSSHSPSAVAISCIFPYSPVIPTAFSLMCYRAAVSTTLQTDRYIWVKFSTSVSPLPLNCSSTADQLLLFKQPNPLSSNPRQAVYPRSASLLEGGSWLGWDDGLMTGCQAVPNRICLERQNGQLYRREKRERSLMDLVLWAAPGHWEMYCSHPCQRLQDICLLCWGDLSGPRRCHGHWHLRKSPCVLWYLAGSPTIIYRTFASNVSSLVGDTNWIRWTFGYLELESHSSVFPSRLSWWPVVGSFCRESVFGCRS